MERNSANYWNSNYVMAFSAVTPAQEYFYLSHVLGRKTSSILNFELNQRGLPTNDLTFEIVRGRHTNFNGEPKIDWTNHGLIWGWIMDYVNHNRVDDQFAAAYETIMAAAIQPDYSCVEATVWRFAHSQIHLPAFSPTRARISIALQGEPFTPHAETEEFLSDVRLAPSNLILHSALTNYMMYMGAYALLEGAAHSYGSWDYAFGGHTTNTAVLSTPSSRPACVSAILQKQFTTVTNLACFYRPEYENLVGRKTVTVDVVKDDTVNYRMEVKEVPPHVTGALALGRITDLFDSTSHLAPTQVIKKVDLQDHRTSYRCAVQLANIYRLFGHDMVFTEYKSGDTIRPFALARSCTITPIGFGRDRDECITYSEVQSVRREGRSFTMPHVDTLGSEDEVRVFIQTPHYSTVEYGNRRNRLMPVVTRRPTELKVLFKVDGGLNVSKVTLDPIKPPPTTSGFHRVESVNPPHAAERKTQDLEVSVSTEGSGHVA
jgi:hypothetical protein